MSTWFIEVHIEFLKRYAVGFSLHKTHGDVPPLNLSSTEFIAVVCSDVTLIGGFGYK